MENRKVIIPTVKESMMKDEGYSAKIDAWLHPDGEVDAGIEKKVKAIVNRLVSKKNCSDVGNFYAESEMKQLNLINYFNALVSTNPKWLLIGEAPGIHGCVKTGIPFTSERIIRLGHLERHFPGSCFGVEGDKAEASATVVWGSVNSLPKPPVMWNAFPLHPKDKNGGNRTPTSAEIEWGIESLDAVINLFPGVRVVTVGRKAEAACQKLRINTEGHLNHPSRRANIFREQFIELLNKN